MSIIYGRIHNIVGNTDDTIYPVTEDSVVNLTSNNSKLPEGVENLRDIVDELGKLAFEDTVVIPAGTTTVPGVVELSNTTNDTTETTKAATVKAVSEVNANAVHTSGDEIVAGTKNFTDGIIRIDGVQIEYDSTEDVLTIGVAPSTPS